MPRAWAMRRGGRLTVGARREALLVDIVVGLREVMEDGLWFGGMGSVEGSGSVETVRANSIQGFELVGRIADFGR